jgi:hypothetical protein
MTKSRVNFSSFSKTPKTTIAPKMTMKTALLRQLKPWVNDQRGVFVNRIINLKKEKIMAGLYNALLKKDFAPPN